ncbi:hypothetical protein ACFXD5_10650 [Streptomyces sp. NPDC059385]|uniref:hypothetical protein n=1 Tax=Streptomyces sp. NPDC059385 TaxID=3346817 RepID=UPI0036BCBC36
MSDGSAELSGHRTGGRRLAPGGCGLEIIRALGADLFASPSNSSKQFIAVLTWCSSAPRRVRD